MAMSNRIARYIEQHTNVSVEDYDEPSEINDVDDVQVNTEVPKVEAVSDAELDQAEDDIEDAAEQSEDDAELYDENEALVEESKDVVAATEHYMEILSYGLENEQYEPQFMAQAAYFLQDYGQVIRTPALEDYDNQNQREFYETSLEAFGKLKKVLKAASDKSFKKIRQTIGTEAKNEKYTKAAKGIRARADAAYAKVDKAEFSEDNAIDVKKGLAKRLQRAGAFPSDIAKAVSDDQKVMTYLSKTYLKSCEQYTRDMIKAANDLVKSDDPQKIINAAYTAKTPAEKMATAMAASGLLVNDSQVYRPDVPTSLEERVKFISTKKAHPTIEEDEKESDAKQVETKITKVDAQQFLKLAKVYAGILEDTAKYAMENLNAVRDDALDTMKIDVDQPTAKDQKDVEHWENLLWHAASTPRYVMAILPDIYRHCNDAANALIDLANHAASKAS